MMNNLSLKQKIIVAIVAIGIALIAIFKFDFYSTGAPQKNISADQNAPASVVATNPSPLENSTILPTQTIEITFNKPIENAGEVKNKIDPKADIKVSLSDDRKTVKVTPNKPYELGQGYTFFITSDTKFDGHRLLGHEEVFHFTTISYNGV